ncbi:MAG: class I SAM-dependent methyltransferase [Bacteroidetes bacterium]|nr:class I SAM-dependent methyltransferase [Bacteroidota bacterium]
MSKDLFSNHAHQYAAFRPTYPQELYDFVFTHVKNFDTAWDAGTGNGQVARDLAKKFKCVFATDISAQQIAKAHPATNIFYSIAGETTTFETNHFNLICVAQALHWFNREKFYMEVNRVANANAIVAIWGYGLLKISPKIDLLIEDFYKNLIGPWWDKERRLIDESYQTISFPFQEIKSPQFAFSFHWTIDQLQGYLTTWSAVQKYIVDKNFNPVEDLIQKIKPYYRSTMEISFPLFMRVGKVNN